MATRIVADNSAAIIAEIERKVGLVLAKGSHDIEGQAKVAAPIDTGFLRAGIGARENGKMRWQVIVLASYGYWVETGTSKRAATPFLIPAYNKVIGTVKTALNRLRARG